MNEQQVQGQMVALVTGASRGIGAAVARMLAERGTDVVVNYRSKGPRAEEVAAAIRAHGRTALLHQADLTDPDDMTAMRDAVTATFGRLDLLVLNASGGMEKDRAEDYAMQLNLVAQERAADLFVPLMPVGGRVVFITSHWAHFYGQTEVAGGYEMVARSKRAGEDALRGRIAGWQERGVDLVVVSGDIIKGTITPRLMDRISPGLIEARRARAGTLPTVDDFAAAIVAAAFDRSLTSGATIYVGSTEE